MTGSEPDNCVSISDFPELGRVKIRSDFLKARNGARSHGRAFVLQGLNRHDDSPEIRFGYTVTKKTGNSVKRNRIRRRLREAVNSLAKAGQISGKLVGYDVIIIARSEAAHQPFVELQQNLAKALHQLVANNRPKGQKRPASQKRPPANPDDKET